MFPGSSADQAILRAWLSGGTGCDECVAAAICGVGLGTSICASGSDFVLVFGLGYAVLWFSSATYLLTGAYLIRYVKSVK